jgi:hypothetical protein
MWVAPKDHRSRNGKARPEPEQLALTATEPPKVPA